MGFVRKEGSRVCGGGGGGGEGEGKAFWGLILILFKIDDKLFFFLRECIVKEA